MKRIDLRLIGLSGLALAALATPAAAQVQEKVFMPWQKPVPQQQVKPSNPALKELLPWLVRDEDDAEQTEKSTDASWDTQIDTPTAPKEPEVAVPKMAEPSLETGAITPGLVMKDKPSQVVPVAEEPSTQKTEPSTAQSKDKTAGTGEDADGPTIALPGDNPKPEKPPIAERTVAQSLANSEDYALDTPAVQEKEPSAVTQEPASEDVMAPVPEPLPESKISTDQETLDRVQAAKEALVGGEKVASKPRLPLRLPPDANVAEQYCFNIADAAKDARYAWQKKTLADIEDELKKRIAKLEERTAEYKKWLARRDEFIKTAKEQVVAIYAGMKPGIAATQLALMHEESAAAVLTKLKTRNASAILNEMEPAKAARLTMIITGAAKLKRQKAQARQEAQRRSEAQAAGGQL